MSELSIASEDKELSAVLLLCFDERYKQVIAALSELNASDSGEADLFRHRKGDFAQEILLARKLKLAFDTSQDNPDSIQIVFVFYKRFGTSYESPGSIGIELGKPGYECLAARNLKQRLRTLFKR